MLNSFPQSPATNADMLVRAFAMAVDDVSTPAICETASRYIKGTIADQDKRYAPSTAQFADSCRYRQSIMDLKPVPRIEAQKEEPITDEERARMRGRWVALLATLGAKES